MSARTPAPAIAGPLRRLVFGDLERLPELLRRHRVLLLALFGSTQKGRRRPGSDLDLAVLFDVPSPEDDWLEQEAALQDDLEVLLRPQCPLHLVVLNRASAVLQREVAEHGVPLYADTEHRWTAFRIRAYRAFADTEKYRRRRHQQLLRDYGVGP